MRFGIRRPSILGRISARTSLKRAIRHRLGLKAPRGWGWLTNPRRAAYNRIYHRTTFSIDSLLFGRHGRRSLARSLTGVVLLLVVAALLTLMGRR